MKIQGILLSKLRYIGDVLLATPALRVLRTSFPDAHITMMVNKGTEDLLRHNPHPNRVVAIDRAKIKNAGFMRGIREQWKLVKELREHRYDVSVDIYSGERAAILSFLSGAPLRIGLKPERGRSGLLINKQICRPEHAHIVEWGLHLLKEGLGLQATDTALELPTGADDDRYASEWLNSHGLHGNDFVAFHAGARYEHRRWAAQKWADLGDVIQNEFGLKVVFVGTSGEVEAIRQINALAKTPLLSCAGETTVLQAAALLRNARAMVGVESAPMHVAAAVGTPVIALFSAAAQPAIWGPWGPGHVVIQKPLPPDFDVRGRKEAEIENLTGDISVADVANVLGQMLRRNEPARPAPIAKPAAGP